MWIILSIVLLLIVIMIVLGSVSQGTMYDWFVLRFCKLKGLLAHEKFFISYTNDSAAWARWIKWQLEEQGYSVRPLQPWRKKNYLEHMCSALSVARRVVIIISPEYWQLLCNNPRPMRVFRYLDRYPERGIAVVSVPVMGQAAALSPEIDSTSLIDQTRSQARSALEHVYVNYSKSEPAVKTHDEEPPYPGELPRISYIPHQDNERRYLVGRRHELNEITTVFEHKKSDSPVLLALIGMHGMGRTQIATEYVYLHQNDYSGGVFWIRITPAEHHTSDLQAIVRQLGQSVPTDQECRDIIRDWLTKHNDWLLVLDQCDDDPVFKRDGDDSDEEDKKKVSDLLPSRGRGCVLLITSRESLPRDLGRFHLIPIKILKEEDAVDLLLRKIGRSQSISDVEKQAARDIVKYLGYFPAAIDVAGAHIKGVNCDLQSYLRYYEQGGSGVKESFYTWKLSFTTLQRKYPASAELLQFCAFLYPHAIPLQLIKTALPYFNEDLRPLQPGSMAFEEKTNEIIDKLCEFSLLEHDGDGPNTVYAINTFVQMILKHGMSPEQECAWARIVVKALSCVFPDRGFETQQDFQIYQYHADICRKYIIDETGGCQGIRSIDAVRLLYVTGCSFQAIAHYAKAEDWLSQAFALREELSSEVPERQYPDLATCRDSIAELDRIQMRYDNAETDCTMAYQKRIAVFGFEHPDTARSLSNLAKLCQMRARYKKVEEQHKATSAIGDEYKKAEEYHKTALAVRQRLFTKNPTAETQSAYASSLDALGGLYADWAHRVLCSERICPGLDDTRELYALWKGKLDEAAMQCTEALRIRINLFHPFHPVIAISYHNLAQIYHSKGDLAQNELTKARDGLSIFTKYLVFFQKKTLRTQIEQLTKSMQKEYREAELTYKKAADICITALRGEHPDTLEILRDLARLYATLGDYAAARSLLDRVLTGSRSIFGSVHPRVDSIRDELADVTRHIS